ncbi:MAG: helix-turn-helix domain-containing protein, partial [Acidimicrobiia bacterium]|nr:helix-turn-helix domain-containing protein [Acidimicrobiia bacterium]
MSPDQLSSDPAFLAAYGAAVGQIREDHGLDRKELAEAASISYSYLSAIESGQRLPSAAVQVALAGALEVEASELLARANGEVETGMPPTLEPGLPVRARQVMPDPSPMHAYAIGRAMQGPAREMTN